MNVYPILFIICIYYFTLYKFQGPQNLNLPMATLMVGIYCLHSILHIISHILLFQMHIVHLYFASEYKIKVQIFTDIYSPWVIQGN